MEKSQLQTGKSIVRNVFYGFLTWILPLGLSFVATREIIKALGTEDYGIYALVLGFIGYSFNFSIGRAITKYIAEYRINGEVEKIKEVISATFYLNIAVGVIVIGIFIGFSRFFVTDVFEIETAAQNKAIYGLYLASLIIFISMLSQVFSAVMQGIHRFDVYSKIYNFNSFALLAGNLILALYGYGLLTLLVWNVVVSFLSCVIFAVYAKRLLPEFGISLKFGREILQTVLKYSSGIIGYQVLSNLLLLFERGWVTRKLGAESLTYYVVPMSLSLYIHGFVSSLLLVVFPLASEMKNDTEKLLRLYTKATKIVCMTVVFLATSLIVESYYFLSLWLGKEFADNSSDLLVLHTITFSLAAILAVSWQMTEGLGYTNYNFSVFSICLVVSVILMIALTPDYGNYGVAFGRLAGFAVIFFSIFKIEKRVFQKIQTRFWMSLIGKLVVAAFFCAIVEKILITNLALNWFTLITATAAGGIVYCVLLFLLNFISVEERQLVNRLFSK